VSRKKSAALSGITQLYYLTGLKPKQGTKKKIQTDGESLVAILLV